MLGLKEKPKTIADYRQLPEGAPYQLIEGELIMTPAPTPSHQIISGNLFKKNSGFVDERKTGIVLYSPVDVYLENENAFQPDIVFISKAKLDIIKKDGIQGAPDLVIEILSPSTAYYDIRKKYRVYERSGVMEYWIVDPEMTAVEIFSLTGQKEFVLKEKAAEKGRVASGLLEGLELSLEYIFNV